MEPLRVLGRLLGPAPFLEHQRRDALELGILLGRADVARQLEPVHPGIDDPELSNTFRVRVPDAKSAAKVVEAVRKVPSVAAAYIKPQDEAP